VVFVEEDVVDSLFVVLIDVVTVVVVVVVVVAVVVVVVVVVVVGLQPGTLSLQSQAPVVSSKMSGSIHSWIQPHPSQHVQNVDSQSPSGKYPSVVQSFFVHSLLFVVLSVVVVVTPQAETCHSSVHFSMSTFHTLSAPQFMMKP